MPAERRGDFRAGAVLSGSWRIFAGGLLFFLGVPVLIDLIVVGVSVGTGLLFGLAGGEAQVGQAVLLVGAFQRPRGEPIRTGAALKRALVRFLPLLGLVLLFGLGLAIVGLICL